MEHRRRRHDAVDRRPSEGRADAIMSELDEVLREWRTGEERLYPVVTVRPDLYKACSDLVRSLANHLQRVPDLDGLVASYRNGSFEAEIGLAGLGLDDVTPEVNRELVRQAAYALRARELQQRGVAEATQHAIDRARRRGEPTAVIWSQGQNELWPPYRRVEMSLATGRAIVVATELSAETMAPEFVVGAVQLDATNGEDFGEEPIVPDRTFTDPEQWRAAAGELRRALLDD